MTTIDKLNKPTIFTSKYRADQVAKENNEDDDMGWTYKVLPTTRVKNRNHLFGGYNVAVFDDGNVLVGCL